jgi:hypothetical protein
MSVIINPWVTTTGAGSFGISSDGHIQGCLYDDPAERQKLAGGVLDASEILPMWGGVAISEAVPGAAFGGGVSLGEPSLGGMIKRATSLIAPTTGQANDGAITGFSSFNQAHSMVMTPQSPVPLVGVGGSVHHVRLGSNARLAVAMDPALVSIDGYEISSLVSWDFGAQRLTTYSAAFGAQVVTGASWAATNGGQSTYTTTGAHGLGVGSSVTFNGFSPAGYNGTYKTITGTTGSTIVVAQPINPGAVVTEGSLVAGGGPLPVKVLEVHVGNSMVVNYDPITGFATWNRNGSTAIILL